MTPTQWQKSRHPAVFQPKITVQHEGIDTENLGPEPNAAIKTPSSTVLKAGDPVVTYVARNLEPYRGFHIFMRALEKLQQQHRGVHAVIVGGDDVSYGKWPKDAKNSREKMLREVKLDATRTHFMGKLPRAQYIKVLQVSAAHVYLTYPFVLSWSLLEAMTCGGNVIACDTAPVREVVRDGENGLVVPFFDKNGIASHAEQSLVQAVDRQARRQRAIETANTYSLHKALRGYTSLIELATTPAMLRQRDYERQLAC